MARGRFKRARRGRSYGFRRGRKHSSAMSKGGVLWTIGGAMAYGAVREKLSNALAPVTSKIPLGNIADEVVLGGISYLAYTKISNPIVKKIAMGGLIVESARIGEAIANGQIGLGGSGAKSGLFDGGGY
jgi:hypothetical protein